MKGQPQLEEMAHKGIRKHFLNPRPAGGENSSVDYAYGPLSIEDILPFLQPASGMDASPLQGKPEDFVVIFGNAGARWIVPASSHRCRQILSSWRPYDLASRIKWQVVEVISFVSLLRYLPDTLCFNFSADRLSENLLKLGLVGNFTPVIQVGNPSPTRKMTLFLLDGSSVHAVIKIPLTKAAVAAVAAEASTLQAMSKLQPAIPQSLQYDSASGWSVQNWVQGSPSSRKFTEQHRSFLLRLVAPDSSTSLKAAFEKNSLIHEALSLPTADKQKLEVAIERLQDSSVLPRTSVHGDFTPWNIKITKGKLRIFDWESARLDSLPLFDICNFFYRQDYLFQEEKKFPNFLLTHDEVMRYLEALSISQSAALHLILYYLVDTYCRHLSHGEDATYQYDLFQIDAVEKEIQALAERT